MLRCASSLAATFVLGTILPAQFSCTSTVIGPGCGPVLTITYAPVGAAGNQDITITATGLTFDSWGVMAWGTMNFSLPLGGCLVHTDMIWGHVFHTTNSTTFSYSRSWPASSPGSYHIQIATLQFDAQGNLLLQATNANRAACQ